LNTKLTAFAGIFSISVSIAMLMWLWPMMSVDPNTIRDVDLASQRVALLCQEFYDLEGYLPSDCIESIPSIQDSCREHPQMEVCSFRIIRP